MRPSLTAALLLAAMAACLGVGWQQARQRPQPQGARSDFERSDLREIAKSDRTTLQPATLPADLGERALQHAKALTSMGPRYTGTPGWTQQLDYIDVELTRLGLKVERDTWTDRKELKTFTNLSACIPGQRRDRILLACHHDTKCTTGHALAEHNFHFVGANDGASGVALLLALAAELSQQTPDPTIELVFFDGEESLDWSWNDAARALFGSRRYVKRYREAQLLDDAPKVRALVLLDMVGRKDLHIQEELYSTPSLRKLLWEAVVACGQQNNFFRHAEAASDDHVPFLDASIPALNLIDLKGNPTWHTKDDVFESLSSTSLQQVGQVVLTLLPALQRQSW